MERYPFDFDPARPFIPQAGEWIADVFYEILPEYGFEVRDEQIYMAFQLERAFAEKKTIFAEAGVGTGKTLVYLLYAVCYARYMRKPAVIACADESLIEQLVKPEGDIAKLVQHLGLAIDARLSKSPDQYVCLTKLDDARLKDDESYRYEQLYKELPGFVRTREALQAFYPYGDRRNYPQLNDEQWGKINWDAFQDCFVCEQRQRCGQTLSRDHYRKAADLIICSHDYYMEHVWTYEGRKREGQLPLLPDHCAVVFDEGHLLESASLKALSYKLKHAVFEELIIRLLKNEIREELALLIDEAIMQSEMMFAQLELHSKAIPGSERKQIILSTSVLGSVLRFREILTAIEEELVFESELYTLDHYQLRIVEEHLEMIQLALGLFQSSEALICWLTDGEDGSTLSIMPRTAKDVLRERVFASRIPIVFSSATLSVDGSFQYVAGNLGIREYFSFSVDSPYDYKRQVTLIAPRWSSSPAFSNKVKIAAGLLKRTDGRALLLFSNKEELQQFKREITLEPQCAGMRLWFEGDQEISHLIGYFQQDEQSVLCAVSLWEGLDIPGPSLSNVIIWSLPFPPQDPVFMARRNASAHPFEEVDMPYMLLRLRQGLGRLIRTSTDTGIAAILDGDLRERDGIWQAVASILPQGAALEEPIF